MEKHCILTNCQNASSKHKMFQFPFKNPHLLKVWLEKIPKSLYSIVTASSFLCETHFDQAALRKIGGVLKLVPGSYPTLFQDSKREATEEEVEIARSFCRFCLKHFEDDEKEIAINHHIRKQFHVITQLELDRSTVYSQNICEKCFDAARHSAKFRTQLIENQRKLEEELQEKSEDIGKSHSIFDDIKVEAEVVVEPPINDPFTNSELEFKVVEQIETVCEEYLDPDLLENDHLIETTHQDVAWEKKQPNEIKTGRTKLCPDCGKTYASHAYKRHYERVHLRLKNYHCDFCSYKTYSRSHIEIHVRSHLKIKTHYCELCGTAFGSGNILRQHFLTHRNDRPFSCEYAECQQSFKSVYALRRHHKTHSENKWRFECDECSAKFTDKWHLTRHKKGHLTQSNPCQICEKVFKTEDRLKAHQIYHRAPQFQCGMCSKEFYKKPDLKTHLKTHTGEKDFQCSICPNSYFKNAHLSRHMKTHFELTQFPENR